MDMPMTTQTNTTHLAPQRLPDETGRARVALWRGRGRGHHRLRQRPFQRRAVEGHGARVRAPEDEVAPAEQGGAHGRVHGDGPGGVGGGGRRADGRQELPWGQPRGGLRPVPEEGLRGRERREGPQPEARVGFGGARPLREQAVVAAGVVVVVAAAEAEAEAAPGGREEEGGGGGGDGGPVPGEDDGEGPQERGEERVGGQKPRPERLQQARSGRRVLVVGRRVVPVARRPGPHRAPQRVPHGPVPPAGVVLGVVPLRVEQRLGVQPPPPHQVAADVRPPRARRQVQAAAAFRVAAPRVEPPAEQEPQGGEVAHHRGPVQAGVPLRVGLLQQGLCRRGPQAALRVVVEVVQRPDLPLPRGVVKHRLPVLRVRCGDVAALLDQELEGPQVAGARREQ